MKKLKEAYGFGNNSELITEVLDFIDNQSFLTGAKAPSDSALTDFEEAKDLAFEKFYEMSGGSGYTWTNIKSKESGKIREKIYEHKDVAKIRSQIDSIVADINRKLVICLNPVYEELLDDIISDMANCVRSRAMLGATNKFYEDIFKAYKSGGWPCGWKGNWPNDGELIVFYPKSQ